MGKIYFLLVRIKIKHMEIDIIKRETTGTGPSVYHENDTIAKYEIMDGAPVRGKAHVCMVGHFAPEASFLNRLQRVFIPGESIPIRLFLAGYDLTPTMRDINKKFSVRYYLNLVLIDEEERRYFKQQVREDEWDGFPSAWNGLIWKRKPRSGYRRRGVYIFILPCVCTVPPQEITLWRKGDVVRKSMSHQAVVASQRFEGSAASESALEQAAKEESG